MAPLKTQPKTHVRLRRSFFDRHDAATGVNTAAFQWPTAQVREQRKRMPDSFPVRLGDQVDNVLADQLLARQPGDDARGERPRAIDRQRVAIRAEAGEAVAQEAAALQGVAEVA